MIAHAHGCRKAGCPTYAAGRMRRFLELGGQTPEVERDLSTLIEAFAGKR